MDRSFVVGSTLTPALEPALCQAAWRAHNDGWTGAIYILILAKKSCKIYKVSQG